MPTRDEDGNIIGLDGFPIALRGDDAREFVLPGSIPESKFDLTAASEDPEEHDCLPPLEHLGPWEMSIKGCEKLAEAMRRLVDAVGEIYAAVIPVDRRSRHYRKVVRWDERNRRRRLKGMPEKPCPYPRTWKTCIIMHKEEDDVSSCSCEPKRKDLGTQNSAGNHSRD